MKLIVATFAICLLDYMAKAQSPVSNPNATTLTDQQKYAITKLQLRALRIQKEYQDAIAGLDDQINQLEQSACGKNAKIVEQGGDLRCEAKPQPSSAPPDPSGHARLAPEEKKK